CAHSPPVPNALQRRSTQCRRTRRIALRRKEARIVKVQDHIRTLEPGASGRAALCAASQAPPGPACDVPPPRPIVAENSSWSASLFGWLIPRTSGSRANRDHAEFPPLSFGHGDGTGVRSSRNEARERLSGTTRSLIDTDRYALVLVKEVIDQISDC